MQNLITTYKHVTLSVENREDVAESRIEFGNSAALALKMAVQNQRLRDEVVIGYSERLSACSLRSNHWVADDLHNRQTGELYAGNGVFKACNTKLCPSCVAKASNRSRKELSLALKNHKLFTGENFQFITLTVPNPNLSLIKTRKILDEIYVLFRKRDFFIRHIRGASKSEEFTVTENGYHYHYHFLAITRFLSFEKFRREWTDCARIIFERYNLPFEVKNKDGLLSVKIEKVNSSRNGLKGAIQEVCKYVTKSDSWSKVPEKDLIEIASIERFPRMFELIGSFRTQRNVNVVSDFVYPFITYLLLLATVRLLTKIKEINDANGNDTILDTNQISDGWNLDFGKTSGNSPPDEKIKTQRRLRWREHIRQFGLESYLERLADEIEVAQEYRRSALKKKYPFAWFKTMDGEIF